MGRSRKEERDFTDYRIRGIEETEQTERRNDKKRRESSADFADLSGSAG